MINLFNSSVDVGWQMKTTLKTSKCNRQAVLNAATAKYLNGCVEETNRRIKQIQQTTYGYRNFNNMITRIMLEAKNVVLKENTLSITA